MNTTLDLTTHRHPAGFRIPLPNGWEVAVDPRPDVALLAVAPDEGDGFRANVVVTLEELGGWSLRDWQDSTGTMLAASLRDYVLLDLERLDDRPGMPGLRRLSHHVASGAAVTLEQWCRVWEGRGLTVSVTSPSLDYALLRPLLAASGEHWRPVSEEVPR
jgi:hypothetical protein